MSQHNSVLGMVVRADLDEIQMHFAQWMWKYNHYRPDMALGRIFSKQ